MKNLKTYDEFLNEGVKGQTQEKIFIQQNLLWIANRPSNGMTLQIKGDPDKFRGFFSSDPEDEHYDFLVKRIEDWSESNKPDQQGKKYKIYRIPCWWGYQDQNDLAIFDGDKKPDYYLWLGLIKMETGVTLVHLFKTKQEAVAFLK